MASACKGFRGLHCLLILFGLICTVIRSLSTFVTYFTKPKISFGKSI